MRRAACTRALSRLRLCTRDRNVAGILFFCAFPNQGKPLWEGAMLSGRESTFSFILSYFDILSFFETFRPFPLFHSFSYCVGSCQNSSPSMSASPSREELMAELRERDEELGAMNAQLQEAGRLGMAMLEELGDLKRGPPSAAGPLRVLIACSSRPLLRGAQGRETCSVDGVAPCGSSAGGRGPGGRGAYC